MHKAWFNYIGDIVAHISLLDIWFAHDFHLYALIDLFLIMVLLKYIFNHFYISQKKPNAYIFPTTNLISLFRTINLRPKAKHNILTWLNNLPKFTEKPIVLDRRKLNLTMPIEKDKTHVTLFCGCLTSLYHST